MNKVFIRKENYGVIVFCPDQNCYYQILDKNFGKEILRYATDGTNVSNEYYDNFKELGLTKYEYVLIDNSIISEKTFVPLEAYFDFTSRCNMNCEYCYNKEFLNNSTMKPSDVKKVLEDFYSLGIARVHLAGGEPTVDYDGLENYLMVGKQLGLKISIATNGTLLTDRICKLLTTSDLISVSISLDSINEEINDKKRTKGSFKKIMQGIDRLLWYKDKNASNLKICLKPVYWPNKSDEEIRSLIEFAIKKKLDVVKFANPERSLAHSVGYFGSIKQSYYDCASRLKRIANDYNGIITITLVTNPVNFPFEIGLAFNNGCIGAQELITINPDGRITPCLMNHTCLGNYFEYVDLKDFLINSKELKDYRRSLSIEECYGCMGYNACRGGCRVRKMVDNCISKADPLCPSEYLHSSPKKAEKENCLMKRINVFHSL